MAPAEIYRLYLLPPGARPKRNQPLPYERVEAFRHLDCHWYAGCLQFVARIPWPGFSCRSCPFFNARPEPSGFLSGKLQQAPRAGKAATSSKRS
ncbi:MAG: hypothetical protein DRI34_03690 [Deltaproteobacteria bacterium]|nr:MAG: hypothetical protein DRI34_03690 [Deltaproteobacteria bacterium]